MRNITEIVLTGTREYDNVLQMTKQTFAVFGGWPDGVYSLYCRLVSKSEAYAMEEVCLPSPG